MRERAWTVLRVLSEPLVLALHICTLPFTPIGCILPLGGVSLLTHGGHQRSWQAVEDGACGLVAAALLGIRSWVLRL